MPTLKKVSLSEAFVSFKETWIPRVGGDINEFRIKLAKFEGAFHWHHQQLEDELFLVINGTLRMSLHATDGGDVVLHSPAITSSCHTVSSIAPRQSRFESEDMIRTAG
jgi:hypothetical protein